MSMLRDAEKPDRYTDPRASEARAFTRSCATLPFKFATRYSQRRSPPLPPVAAGAAAGAVGAVGAVGAAGAAGAAGKETARAAGGDRRPRLRDGAAPASARGGAGVAPVASCMKLGLACMRDAPCLLNAGVQEAPRTRRPRCCWPSRTQRLSEGLIASVTAPVASAVAAPCGVASSENRSVRAA